MKIKIENKYLKYTLIISICLILSFLIELLIFNYGGIRTSLEKNKDVNIDYYLLDTKYTDRDLIEYEKLELQKGNSTLKNGNNLIFITDINFPVSSLNIYYNKAYDAKNIYDLNFTAYGNEYLFYRTEEKMINLNDDAYILFDTKTDCYSIALYINASAKDLGIEKIILNHPNFNINPLRIICIFILSILTYFIISKKIYRFNTEYNKKSKLILLIISTLLIILFTTYIYYNINKSNLSKFVYTDSYSIENLDIYNSCVKSIINNTDGEFELNPILAKNAYNLAEYNGKYYYYLNRLPIYLISLPYYFMTSTYINVYFLNLILLIITIIISAIFYNRLLKHFTKKISLFNYILGYIALVLGSNILFARRAYSPDLAFLSNINLIMLGIVFVLNILNAKNKILKWIYTLILGIISGLLIFSTPLSVIYILLFITLYLILNKKNIVKTKEKNKKINIRNIFKTNKEVLINLLLFTIPIIIFIIVTCIYNYNRFDSIFEYGYRYNTLRIDHTYTRNLNLGYILSGIIESIVIVPNIDLFDFPFFKMDVTNNVSFLNEFTYAHNVLGIISFPIIWLLLCKKFLKDYKGNSTKYTLKFINVSIVFSFIILLFNILLNGISEIFTLEFKFLLMTSSLLFIFKYIEKTEENKENTYINTIFLIFALINIIVMIPISISTDKLYLYMTNIDFVNNLKNLFMFWM